MPFTSSPSNPRRTGRLRGPARLGGLVVLTVAALTCASPAGAQTPTPDACRASAVRVSAAPLAVVEPVVANSPASPCASDDHQVAGVTPVGALSVSTPRAMTRSQPGVIAASAGIANVSLTLGAVPITVGAVSVDQTQSCTAGTTTATGGSTVDALTILGVPVPLIAGRTLDLNVGIVRVRTNQLVGDTRQALVLDAAGTQVVLGEARASGDACATPADGTGGIGAAGGTPGGGGADGQPATTGTTGAGPGGPGTGAGTAARICPTGASYRVSDNVCIITTGSGSGSGTGTTIVVGAPYAGPSGGSVLSLQAALAMVKAGKLADSACLHGRGSKYVLLGTSNRADQLTGTNGDDRILALGGNDQVDGGRGADCVDGAGGSDTLTGGAGNDHVIGGTGNDHLNGGPGADTIDGNAGNDTINAAFGADRLNGGSGNDAINASTAGPAATINGGTGRDTVRINANERTRVKSGERVHVLR